MVSIDKILENVNSVVVGKENTVKLILTAMLAEGHVLIEDVPGVGKTTFANAFAKPLTVHSHESSLHRILCRGMLLALQFIILKAMNLNMCLERLWVTLFLQMKLTEHPLRPRQVCLRLWKREG